MQSTIQMVPLNHKNTGKSLNNFLPLQHNFPYLTLLFGFFTIIISLSSQVTSWLQFDRTAILHGEIWRIITGHLTHWSTSQLFWDLLVFIVVAGIIERFSRRQLLVCFAAVSFFTSLLVFIVLPEMKFYRGLSGIDSGMFMMLLVMLYRMKAEGQNLLQKVPYLLLGFLFISKSALELSTAQAIFVESSDLFVPVPLVHLGGIFIGWIIGTLHFPNTEACID